LFGRCHLKACLVALSQKLRLAVIPATPDRTYGMQDGLGRQLEARSRCDASCGHRAKFTAMGQEVRAGGAVDGPGEGMFRLV